MARRPLIPNPIPFIGLLGVLAVLGLQSCPALAEDAVLDAFRLAKETYYRDPKQAVALFEDFIRKHRDSEWTPQAYYWYAKSLEAAKGDRSDVIRAYALFLRRYPDNELCDEAAFAIADSYRNQRNSQDDLKTALDRYLKFVADYPRSDRLPEAFVKIGDLYRALKDYPKAIEAFRKVIREHPDSPFVLPARTGEADCFHLDNKLDQAIDCYTRLLDVPMNDGGRQETRLGLLDCLLEAGRLDDALKQASIIRDEADRKRFRQDYAEFQTRFRLADTYAVTQQYDAAIRELQAYVDRFPHSDSVWQVRLKLAAVHISAGSFTKARRQYRAIISEHPAAKSDNPPAVVVAAQYGIGYAYELEKRFEDAVKQYQLVVQTYPRQECAQDAQKRLEALRKKIQAAPANQPQANH